MRRARGRGGSRASQARQESRSRSRSLDDYIADLSRNLTRDGIDVRTLQQSLGNKSNKTQGSDVRAEIPNIRPAGGAGGVVGPQGSRLDHELTNILQASTFAQHVDPPSVELEDQVSRLKTQCIQLATHISYLQHQVESERAKQKPPHLNSIITRRASQTGSLGSSKSGHISTGTSSENGIKSPAEDLLSAGNSPPALNPWLGRLRSATIHCTDTHSSLLGSDLRANIPNNSNMADSSSSPSPMLDRLLDEVRAAIQRRDGERLARDLQIEPPLGQPYIEVSQELQRHHLAGSEQKLRAACQQVLPKITESSKYAWESFGAHLLEYLRFLRDHNPSDNHLKTSNDITRLLNTAVVCLGDTTFGLLILPSVVYLGKVLAGISLALDKRPELVAQLWRDIPVSQDNSKRKKITFVEDAANILREAFIKCLSDRSSPSGIGRHVAPHGKREGIYTIGNLCFRLLFQCGKLASATTMFVSIDAQSPLLSYYPAAQRVTYLYYLGRYLFANNHFYRAQLALQAAYYQCHPSALTNRRLILVYLIASNVCLGKFPSSKLLLRREAAVLAKYYLPLCRLIASGNLSGFHDYLSLDNPHGQWFLRRRLLFQLRNRCELLVWRSLARRVFIEVGYPGGEDNRTPVLRLSLLQAAAQFASQTTGRSGSQPNLMLSQTAFHPSFENSQIIYNATMTKGITEDIDPEFEGMEDAIAETGFDVETGTYQQLENGGQRENDRAKEINAVRDIGPEAYPTIEEVESVMASLIQQDLICGFLTHRIPRFAIPGAKSRGALAVGFPCIWEVIQARKQGTDVPGWVKQDEQPNNNVHAVDSPLSALGGGGRVVNLSGAKPVGAAAIG